MFYLGFIQVEMVPAAAGDKFRTVKGKNSPCCCGGEVLNDNEAFNAFM